MAKGIWQHDDNTWDTGDDRTDEGSRLTWADIKAMVCAAKRDVGRSAKYINELGYTMDRTAAWCARQEKLIAPQNFGKTAADRLIAHLKAEGKGARTMNMFAIQLKMVFKWLFMEGYFPKDNLARLKNPPAKDERSRLRLAITREEYERMMAANKKMWAEDNPKSRFHSQVARDFHTLRNACMLTMLVDGGLRRKEMCLLPLSALNMEQGVLILPSSLTKARKDRVAALSRDFVDGLLRRWLTLRTKLMQGHPDPGTVFITERRGVISPCSWNKRFDRIRKAAGIERNITPHSCRRTGSTALDTVDAELSKKMIGHESNAVHDLYHVVSPAEISKMRKLKDQAGMWGSGG